MSNRVSELARAGEDRRRNNAASAKASAPSRPSPHSVEGVLELQRTVGNRAVSRMAATGGFLQRKLKVGPAGDKFEREADKVADHVMRDLSAPVRTDDVAAPVRRYPLDGEVGLEGGPLTAGTEAAVNRHRGGGTPLPRDLQRTMGQSFGADFSGVRMHTGPAADELSRSMQARAFTVGSDIFLSRGQYRPDTTSGQRLIAHELTHTVQQGAVGRSVDRTTAAAPFIQRLAVQSDNLKDWNNLASGKASGGVNGVIFATAPDNSKIVVKGMEEPPQRVMLAQDVFENVGVQTTETRPIAVSSKLGQKIIQELLALAVRMGNTADAAAITAKATAWQNYQTLLLMAPANVKNMSQLIAQGPGLAPPPAGTSFPVRADFQQHVTWWNNMMANQLLWEDFGRVFYIDQFLGNEDRFENMKMQNVFIDPTTFRVIALDNDTIAADYISQITEIDAIFNRNKPTTTVINLTPDDYIENIINGGMIYNGAIQARAMASLNEISGKSSELKTKVGQKLLTFVQTLAGGVQNGTSPNERAARQVLAAVIANQNGLLANAQRSMTLGAVRAREKLQDMFRNTNQAEPFAALFNRQLVQYKKGVNTKLDPLYNFLALEIRYRYLAHRAADLDHQAALDEVQDECRARVAAIGRTATTEKDQDYNDVLTGLSERPKEKKTKKKK